MRRSLAVLTVLLTIACTHISQAQNAPFNAARQKWIDSIYNKLTDMERIGQLFMVAAYSGGKDYNEDKIRELLAAHQVGGLIFMQGTPGAQASLNNMYQGMAQVPLLIGMDAEWGLSMRLSGVDDLPRQMTVGATRDTALAYQLGAAVAAQCKRLGVHIDFAPVVDVNNNPDNPIINARSFGEDKKWVARLGIAYMRGLQNNGVMACAKHFPGHGDTDVDSHKDLPSIYKSFARLDTLELYPFREMIKAGVKSIMVAHLNVPALDTGAHTPTTLSKNTITNLLKIQMGFKGLVFTDALNMKGVTRYFEPGEVDLQAFLAGNDMLLFSQDVPTAIGKIQQAINDSVITTAALEQRVKKILGAKYDAGLNKWRPVNTANLTADLNQYAAPLRQRMAEKAITLIRDRNNILDDINKQNVQVGYIGVNATGSTALYEQLLLSKPGIKVGWIPHNSTEVVQNRATDAMAGTDMIVIGVHNMGFYPSGGDYGLDASQLSFLKKMQKKSNVIFVVMGNPYILKYFCDVSSVMVGYEDDTLSQIVAAKILTGELPAKGTLPVTPCRGMKMEVKARPVVVAKSTSKQLEKVDFNEVAGVVNQEALDRLSMFIQKTIVAGAFPGCRIIASRNGKVFYNESFGYYTFSKDKPVDNNTIYDVASVTKVLSTTLAVMRLYETGKLDLDKKIGDYLNWTKGTDKAGLRIRDLLMHQAGLKSWIPFYKETLDEAGNLRTDLYRKTPDNDFNIEVAKDLYLRKDYPDTIWSRILNSPLENKGKYVYSDLDYYFLAAIAEQVTGQRIDKYVDEQFYKPMALKRISYNPLKKFPEADITPTENDLIFRHQLIKGYVHDPGAALFGGVAGHAGIFASADDVAAIFQMLLNGGTYNGKRFFKKETVNYFTAYSSHISRRALGFDKPATDKEDGGPAGNRTTGYAFGHQGFTGTCAWADPGTGIVFVFLSNRVNPSADNNAINRLSVRTVVQDYIYEASGMPVVRNRADVQKQQLTSLK